MASVKVEDEEKLLLYITLKREEMIKLATNTGFTSDETIKCSQDLDLLLNKYQRIKVLTKKRKNFRQFMRCCNRQVKMNTFC
ncbi:aspartyl-phosphate phosphatase Spo0E family protein [Cytobacillus sp. S13-E01]|uniref:aspartyl-phosphate phosphatase Spo0E family protein n=1 Tax=Cytobacillus sp. S13-E01 TaxID=3031326 RepID=UPI0023D809AC|nr:aspartyl-phosphate phosphatase Spo0E family protein [Cytobacillus sp. S13-E01]MDF0729053.1 aspartyl-phosphate phosphatase Spo0E family protein [Cytobacillus sp. S13-E01]